MNWNDYEEVWKRQALPVGATADVAELRHTFEAKRRKLAATLLVRDALEASAGLLVAGVFAFVWWHMGKEGWPIAPAIVLLLGVTGFFVRERIRTHRQRLGPEASVLAKLEAELAELRHQRRLLLDLWAWYLAPCAGAIVCFGLAVIRKMILDLPPGFFTKLLDHPLLVAGILGYCVVFLPLLFWGIRAMNRRAVRKNIEPRIEELEKLRQELHVSG
jgi:xanthosine utilization system XapX-like protein